MSSVKDTATENEVVEEAFKSVTGDLEFIGAYQRFGGKLGQVETIEQKRDVITLFSGWNMRKMLFAEE